MQQDVRIAGPAVTVHQPGVDGTIIGYALGQLRPGDVLVVDRCGDMRHAGSAASSCYAAKVAKVAGVIIDGVVADIAEIRQYGVPGVVPRPVRDHDQAHRPGRIVLRAGLVRRRVGASGRRDHRRRMRRRRDGSRPMPKRPPTARSRCSTPRSTERARLDAGEKLPDISGATKVLADALAKQK